jgi:type I restriction enzyme S subunit
MNFKKYTLAELATIKYGKNQKKVLSENGAIPIYGTGGLMGYATEPLYSEPSVLIGRKGSIGKVKYVDHPFWTVDTLFYTIVNTEIVLPKYLYYVMSLLDLNNYNEGTTIPSLRTETLNRLEFDIPSLEEQELILSYLNPIDKKIEINSAINDNLRQQASTLFASWFINYDPWNGTMPSTWENAPLGAFVDIKRGGSPRPIQDFLSDTGYRWLKISDVLH